MKKSVLILCTIALTACGGKKVEVSEDLTYQQRVSKTCECFKNSKDISDCYTLQAKHLKYVEDDKVIEFTKSTNQCQSN